MDDAAGLGTSTLREAASLNGQPDGSYYGRYARKRNAKMAFWMEHGISVQACVTPCPQSDLSSSGLKGG